MDDDDDDNTGGGGAGGGADDDLLSSLMSRLPSISSSQELVQTFASICNIDNGLAQFFIDSSGGNLPVAINLFYEYGATAGGGGGGGGGGRRRPIASHGGAGGGGSVSQLDASLASFLGVGAAPSSFSSMPASDGAFGGYSGVVAGGGEEEDEDEGGDKAMQMAIALSSGIAVSDIDQMRAIEAQNAALFRAEQARASNPFAAYGFAPAQQAAPAMASSLPLAAPAAASTGAMVIGSASSSSSASSNSAAFAMQGSSSNSGGDMDDS